jgi:hypothetical protein
VNWVPGTLERAGAADGAAARPLERPAPQTTGNLPSPGCLPRRENRTLDSCRCVKGGVDPSCERHTTGGWRVSEALIDLRTTAASLRRPRHETAYPTKPKRDA